MKKTAVILLIILALIFTLSSCKDAHENDDPPAPPKPLSFKDGAFRIVQFTDFHAYAAVEKNNFLFEEKDTLPPLLTAYVNTVLDTYSPGLVVLTGDNIFSLSILYDFNENGVSVRTYKLIAELFENRRQYWTMTFGNHDSESIRVKEDFLNAVKDYSYFMGGSKTAEYYESYEFFGLDGDGETDTRLCNFSIPVYSGQVVKYNVYVLDSGSYEYVPSSSLPYRCIRDEQVDWYKSVSDRLKTNNGGNPLPSLLFTHIPFLEQKEAYQQNGEYIGRWGGFSPSTLRSSIFETALEAGDIRGIFTGHNHFNTITCFYTRGAKKIMLGITPQATVGYNDTERLLRSRIIDLYEDGNLKTFIDTSDTETYPDRIEYSESLWYLSH